MPDATTPARAEQDYQRFAREVTEEMLRADYDWPMKRPSREELAAIVAVCTGPSADVPERYRGQYEQRIRGWNYALLIALDGLRERGWTITPPADG